MIENFDLVLIGSTNQMFSVEAKRWRLNNKWGRNLWAVYIYCTSRTSELISLFARYVVIFFSKMLKSEIKSMTQTVFTTVKCKQLRGKKITIF